jgi:monovalent cation/hydrogen antiporter
MLEFRDSSAEKHSFDEISDRHRRSSPHLRYPCLDPVMQAAGIHNFEFIFLLLLLFVAGLAALAKRFQIPYPIILVIGGLVLGLFPRVPRLELNPDIVFLVILPPLLFASAFVTSWRDFRYNLVSISMLAFGLVLFTVWGVAAACRWILPGFDWRLGLVLGAVVSTTDAIAVTSIAKRLGLPKRITSTIEGESLVNDASGLVAFEFTTALLVSDSTPSPLQGVGHFLYLISASLAIGLLVAKLIYFVGLRINDAAIETTLSLIAPYVAYLAAGSIHASGVLATVVCGLYLGHKSSFYLSLAARLQGPAVWGTLTFILNGFVFILLGLQLPYILDDIHGYTLGRLLWLGLEFSLAVILLRLIWVYPGALVSNFVRSRLLHQPEPLPDPQSVFLIGWAGMRGVLALTAAISLPKFLNNGSPFPQRALIIFLTFSVICATLVGQGLTLPLFIRRFGLANAGGKNPEETLARRGMMEAALAFLESARSDDAPESAPVYDELIRLQRLRLGLFQEAATTDASHGHGSEQYERFLAFSRQIRAVQRAALLHLYNQHQIGDETLRNLEYELDLLDEQYAISRPR